MMGDQSGSYLLGECVAIPEADSLHREVCGIEMGKSPFEILTLQVPLTTIELLDVGETLFNGLATDCSHFHPPHLDRGVGGNCRRVGSHIGHGTHPL